MGLNSFQTSGNSPGATGCRVGLLGFGTVGQAIARRLTSPDLPPSLHLTHICDRRAREKQARQSDPLVKLVWTDRFDDLITSEVDVIVEAVSGSEPASDYVRAGLLAGKSVVTVNKLVIAHHGQALLTLAGEITVTGAGAGGDATAVAAIGDLVAIARDRAAIVPAPVLTDPQQISGLSEHQLAEAV